MNKRLEWVAAAALLVLLSACKQNSEAPVETPQAVAAQPAAQSPAVEAGSAPPSASEPAQPGMARDIPSAGAVERVKVTATGQGPTQTVAVDRAIRIAIEQVNGKSVDASFTSVQMGMAVAAGEKTLDLGAAGFAEMVTQHSRGAVTDFRVVSQPPRAADGTYEVTIEANVAKFQQSAAAKRLKVSIAPVRAASSTFVVDGKRVAAAEVARQLRESLIESLTQTERFALLDRAVSAEIDAELERVADGRAAHQDIARIGQELSADYLLLARIDKFAYDHHERELRTSDRRLVWHSGGAKLTLRLVNVATGQIEQADNIEVVLPKTEPTTLGTQVDANAITEDLLRRLSDGASRNVVGKLFPITVVAVEGEQLILSQGGKALVAGKRYEVVVRGKEIKDPQTGQSLGRLEEHCCVVVVTQVLPQMSYGKVVESARDVAALFAPGALELRGEVAAPAATAKAPRAAQPDREEPEPADAEAAPKKDTNW